jgi:hypothetical protein
VGDGALGFDLSVEEALEGSDLSPLQSEGSTDDLAQLLLPVGS